MTEANLMRQIQIALSKIGARFFRNNVAVAWVGNSVKITREMTVTVRPGDVVIRQARPLHAGLCKGSSDLIGWTPLKITPDHVGLTVAIFSAAEIKIKDGKTTKEQRLFLDAVREAGGIAFEARSEDDALRGVRWRTESDWISKG